MERQNDQGGTEDRKWENEEGKKRDLRRAMKCELLLQQLVQVADFRLPKRFKAPRLRGKKNAGLEDGKRPQTEKQLEDGKILGL